MKSFILASFLVMTSNYGLAADENCQKLKDGIKLTFESVPNEVNAGENISFVMHAALDEKLLDDWKESVTLYLLLDNGIPGSRSPLYDLPLKTDGQISKPFKLEVDDKIPANFIGKYKLVGNIFAYGGPTTRCGGKLPNIPNTSFQVINDEESADIFAPIVSQFKFDKSTYKAGDQVVITFKAEDKSGICTKALKEAKKCDAVWHVSLTNQQGDKHINNYDAAVVDIGKTHYKVEFKLPENAVASSYKLSIVNVYDIFDNASAQLTDLEQPTMMLEK